MTQCETCGGIPCKEGCNTRVVCDYCGQPAPVREGSSYTVYGAHRNGAGDECTHQGVAIGGCTCHHQRGSVERMMYHWLIRSAARSFVDYRGKSGNFDSLLRSRAVDLFSPSEDANSAACRAAFKRLARLYRAA